MLIDNSIRVEVDNTTAWSIRRVVSLELLVDASAPDRRRVRGLLLGRHQGHLFGHALQRQDSGPQTPHHKRNYSLEILADSSSDRLLKAGIWELMIVQQTTSTARLMEEGSLEFAMALHVYHSVVLFSSNAGPLRHL